MLTRTQVSFVWLVVATLVAFASIGLATRRTGADREAVHSLLSDIVLWALIGSRLIYALADPAATLEQPARLLLLNGLLALRGAAAGAVLAVLYHLWRGRLTGSATVNGAVLILATAAPALLLAWGPEGVPTRGSASIHPVGVYYAVAHVALTLGLWVRPHQAVTDYAVFLGLIFLLLENFRQTPLLGGLATGLQLVGAIGVVAGLAFRKPINSVDKG